MFVCIYQLPQREHYVVGLHMVISVLRLASARLHATVWSLKQEPASQAVFTHPRSEAGESSNDNVQCVSSAVSRTSASSESFCLASSMFLLMIVIG